MVAALGKQKGEKLFKDFAKIFMNSLNQADADYTRIGIVFDRYTEESVKAGTRIRRRRGTLIHRIIESEDVPFPKDWQGFLSLPENKADFTRYLSEKVSQSETIKETLVIGGGFLEESKVFSNGIMQLEGHHEEADTKIILHCANAKINTILCLPEIQMYYIYL